LRPFAGERLGVRRGRKGRSRHEVRTSANRHKGEGGYSRLHSEWQGLTGTVSGKWGSPEYLALDLLLDDGRAQLFWHHELEEILQRAYAGSYAHRLVEHSLREEKRQQGRRYTVMTSGMATQAKEIEVVNTAEVRSEILDESEMKGGMAPLERSIHPND
jgi:hypothetical protein